jgi:DNA-directed RNA polymerase subunit M/transcription elongation factor TFIIS
MGDEELVTIATFRSLGEAYAAKGALESEGIDCELADENTAVNYPLAIGVRLQVQPKDQVKARQILVDVEPETDEETPQDQKICPKCGSPEIKYVKSVFSDDPSHWQCKECRARWVVEPD